jgi:predicted permease
MTATFHTHVDRATSTVSADILPRALWMAQVAKSVLTSPLIVCVIIGLLCNVLFHDFLDVPKGEIPFFLNKICGTVGSVFPGIALFLTGVSVSLAVALAPRDT